MLLPGLDRGGGGAPGMGFCRPERITGLRGLYGPQFSTNSILCCVQALIMSMCDVAMGSAVDLVWVQVRP